MEMKCLSWHIAMNPNNCNIEQDDLSFSDLESAYVSLRDREGRLYSDNIVAVLPEYSSSDFLNKEWAIRKESMSRLLTYLKQDVSKQEIMELGCGNGWLSNAMAQLTHLNVSGVDVNREELRQATRVFTKGNLSFAYGDVFSLHFPTKKYHKIIIAAAVQYFSDFSLLISRLMDLLHPMGEIHIIDSPFYEESDSALAKDRSEQYYKKMNAEAMIPFYHHHEWEVLKPYCYRIVKTSFLKKIQQKASGTANPFPWIVIEKNRSDAQ